MLHQTVLFLGQLWQLFEVSQILEFLRYEPQNDKATKWYVRERRFSFGLGIRSIRSEPPLKVQPSGAGPRSAIGRAPDS